MTVEEEATKDVNEGEPNEQLNVEIQQEVYLGILINLVIWPILLVIGVYLAYKHNRQWVPYQFIDEAFHVNQTLEYIGGRWKSWDSKITTPPGLYLLGWLQYKLGSILTPWSSLALLRTVNLMGGLIVWAWVVLRPLYLFNALGFWPITLVIFPLMANYYFLYYTDIWSTIFIVESLTLAITLPFGEQRSIWASAFCGLVSCLFRQTNIIWNGFIMTLVVERRAMIQKDFNNFNLNNYLKLLLHAVENFRMLVLPYAVNFLLFSVFLFYNKSITLGDKDSHVAGFHVTQIFYCLTFLTFFSLPVWFCRGFFMQYLGRAIMRPFRTLFEIIGIMLSIRMFSIVHPYLLADNRHFTFYLFRRLIARNRFFKYLVMAPIYHFSIFTYLEIIRPSTIFFHPILPIEIKNPLELPLQLTHISWTALIVCTFLSVVPAPLFEPRYFLLPYIFWRIFIVVSPEPFFDIPSATANYMGNTKRLSMEFIWFLLIDIFTLTIFSRYAFHWDTELFPQRIIW